MSLFWGRETPFWLKKGFFTPLCREDHHTAEVMSPFVSKPALGSQVVPRAGKQHSNVRGSHKYCASTQSTTKGTARGQLGYIRVSWTAGAIVAGKVRQS